MSIIQERIDECTKLMVEIKNHPMCFRFQEDKVCVMVFYPLGDFPVDGIRVSKEAGKANALRLALDKMEKHWMESYP